MRSKAAFIIGGAVGYVLGTRAGREQFEKIRGQAQKVWADPRVQGTVSDVEHRATSLVREKGPELKDKVTGAVRSATDTVRSRTGGDEHGHLDTGYADTGYAEPGTTPDNGTSSTTATPRSEF